ncbi:MAG: toll/interleukin-1 receptor domain-containing protein [Planctomycetaceae bacterium]
MAFFSDQQVLRAAAVSVGETTRSMTEFKATAALNDLRPRVPEAVESGSPVKTFDIFLSYSSLDATMVLGIYQILLKKGYSVYLDRTCDPHLHGLPVSKATATTIRRRMPQCRSLFVATSSRTTSSQWVPWELGVTDGLTGKAAVLPILPDGTVSFGGPAYFELHPAVQDNPTVSKSNDLTIWDGSSLIGTWGTWLAMAKRY